MANWYVNSDTGNDTTGDGSQGNPYKSLAKACTMAIDSDTVFCTNGIGNVPEIATVLALPKSGTTSNPFRIIGVDSDWVQRNTSMYKINGNSTVNYCIQGNSAGNSNFVEVSNIEGYNFTTTVFGLQNSASGALIWKFINCVARNSVNGFVIPYTAAAPLIFGCRASNNSGYGFYSIATGGQINSCSAYNNAGGGFWGFNYVQLCLSYDNLVVNFRTVNAAHFYGCTSDNAPTGYYTVGSSNGWTILAGCIDTNCTTPLFNNNSTHIVFSMACFLQGFTTINQGRYVDIRSSSITSGVDGYVNRANKNFMRTRLGSITSLESAVGEYSSSNKIYWTAGLPRIEPVLPAVGDVEVGVTYGDNGNELTGTLLAGGSGSKSQTSQFVGTKRGSK